METPPEPPPSPAVSQPRAVRVAATLLAVCLAAWLLRVGRPFFITLISSVLLAFILEPLVQLFMRLRMRRGFASFLACSLMLGAVYLALLGVWSQAVGFWAEMPNYSKRITELVDSASLKVEDVQRSLEETLIPPRLRRIQPPELPGKAISAKSRKAVSASAATPQSAVQEVRIKQEPGDLVSLVWESLSRFSDALLLASFVPFLVYFFLSWRDHLRRGLLDLAGGRSREMLDHSLRGVANVTRAYVVGNFLLGLLLSLASGAFFYFNRVPYWQVAGPLSGFLSLIPYLGLPLALLPPFIAALPVFDNWEPYLLVGVGIALLHMVALNLLYPKLVGARVHLNPLVVTVALMVWYILWGGAGLVLAIPLTAGMKAVFDSVPGLNGYGKLLGD
ncbi:MAG: AI-2E family transporter [Bryobacteraceae bacterium]|jgi:predicted PurR-regulated permease PerM